MDFNLLHPADQLVMMMERIYDFGMTTTSGGNLSIKDSDGNVWITPGSIDKGNLKREDINCVRPDGTIEGIHKPSSELPFHMKLYETRPDVKAVVHAHPPALVAFSVARKIPDTSIIASAKMLCGEVRMAKYDVPGSEKLGENIAAEFVDGVNVVMLENHGVVIAHENLFRAFMAFETFDFCARLQVNACNLGKPVGLTSEQMTKYLARQFPDLDEFYHSDYSSEERAVRRDMITLIHRAYSQELFTSTQGTFSCRMSDSSFVITPYGKDRKYLEPEDLVNIRNGRREAGKVPSRAVRLHQAIYEKSPGINSIIIAHPPNILAFAVTGEEFDARLIPESYIMLRDVVRLPYGINFLNPLGVADEITEHTPVGIVENDCVIVTGDSLLNAFDRLEVMEYSAKSVIAAKGIGEIVKISDEEIDEIKRVFNIS